MYHPRSKRAEFWRRTATYGAMVIAIIGLVAALVLVILGYRINQDDGKLEQGGLVQFSSQPGGASVTLDGTLFGARTNTKATMTAGDHQVTMTRSGYQEWRKAITVVPGAVLWLNYARLIPQDLPVTKVASFPVVSSSITSPNKEFIALVADPAVAELQLADISGTDPVMTKITLPQTLFTHPVGDKTQNFSVEEWDRDNRLVLVKHTIQDADRAEWLIVDTRSPESSKNVTHLLNISSTDMRFSRANSQTLYALTDSDVRKIDVAAGTLSRPLVSNVAKFELYRDTGVVYTTKLDAETGQRSVGYALDSDDEPRQLKVFKDDGTAALHIDIGEYFGDTYVAIAHGTAVEIVTGELPKKAADLGAMQRVASMSLSAPIDHLSIITAGRFVVADMKDSYAVYDLEIKRETVTQLKGATPENPRQLNWIDGYMPWSDRDSTLRLYEFDGANQHDIMPVVSGQAVTLSRNGTYLYGVGKAADGQYQLQRVRLILP